MKNPDRYFYPAVFTYEEGKAIAVSFPDLSIITIGTDQNDALLSAREVLGITLCEMEENRTEIPEPSQLKDLRLKENEKAVLIDVYMPSIRLAHNNRCINRSVTLPAWLNAMALERNINFSAALQRALKEELQDELNL